MALEVFNSEWAQVGAVLCLLWLVIIAFIKDWASPDIIAMTAFCVLIFGGFLSVEKAYGVFSNSAPITIAAMFILSAALEKTGVIDSMGHVLNRVIGRHMWLSLPALVLLVAFFSAFVNNTPVVAVMLPVVLAVCRRKHLPASKFLIPLSYAAVLGGCCTLIGTSTNILADGIAVELGQAPLRMFEFANLGLIMLGVGLAYIWIAGPWLLPDRLSVSAVLSSKERQQYLCHLLVKPASPLVGHRLADTELANPDEGFRIIEVRRSGARLALPLNEIVVNAYDRVLVSVSSGKMEPSPVGTQTIKATLSDLLGIENLSTIQGAIIEGVVAAHSRLLGQTLKSIRFRQTYGMLVLGVHRGGANLSSDFHNEELMFGDTVLMLGPLSTFAQFRDEGDFMLLEDKLPERGNRKQATLAITALAAVVGFSALKWSPIVFAATVAVVLVLWFRCISPQEAYKSVDWTVIFMLYGMLALGEAMTTTGAAGMLASALVNGTQSYIPADWLPYVTLSLFYLMGSALTEVLSNNTTVLVLAPIAINTALSLELDPRPFIFAVAFSSSAAFASPIGYQTHMMVYGAGGYKFSDFVKFGLPLNIILWGVASFMIPRIWPFYPSP